METANRRRIGTLSIQHEARKSTYRKIVDLRFCEKRADTLVVLRCAAIQSCFSIMT